MNNRWLLSFRSAQGDMTFSCVVRAEPGDEVKGEIERRAMKLEKETGVPWLCESVRPMPETNRKGGDGDA